MDRYPIHRAALQSGMLDEAAEHLQRWFEVVPRSDFVNGGVSASARTLIDSAIEFLEHPQSPNHPAAERVWNDLQRLYSEVSSITTADNDTGFRRLLQRRMI